MCNRHRGTTQTFVSMPWEADANPQYLHRQEYSHADPNPAGDRLASDGRPRRAYAGNKATSTIYLEPAQGVEKNKGVIVN